MSEEILPLARMARKMGVTTEWLREQAEMGNVPCLKTGKKRYLFNVAAVQEVLADMAAQNREGGEK